MLRNARMRSVLFRDKTTSDFPPQNDRQFFGTVDLRGFTYDRIDVAWRELLLELSPFDPQPYGELENALRKGGQDDDADYVYLARKAAEHSRMPWVDKCADSLYSVVANYGIGLTHLAIFTLILVLVGIWVFSRPEAAEPLSPEGANPQDLWPRLWNAFWVTIHCLWPLDLVSTQRKSASRTRVQVRLGNSGRSIHLLQPASYANLLRALGWILVPLAIGVVTGLLRRIGP
jgi:hypothetical protein